MPSETKAGVAIVLVLIGAFGFIAWNKYGKSLKPADGIVNNGEPGDQETVLETPPARPTEGMPSAFGADDGQVRMAANEEEFFGDQAEPEAAQAAPPGDFGEPETAAASSIAAAQATPVEPDTFVGFDDTAMEPVPGTATAEPAAMAQANQSQAGAFAADLFADTATVQTQQPVQATPTETAQADPDSWGSVAQVAAAPAATEQPDPFDPGFESEPMETAQAQPERVAVDTTPSNLFEDSFETAPATQQQPVQRPTQRPQPAPVADASFGDDAFGGGAFGGGAFGEDAFGNETFNPKATPAAAPREPDHDPHKNNHQHHLMSG